MDTYGEQQSKIFQGIGYAEGSLKNIKHLADLPKASGAIMALRMEQIAEAAERALAKLGEVM